MDKEDLMQMVKDKKVKPILSGEKEFWEAFMCLHYDKWYEVRLVFAFFWKVSRLCASSDFAYIHTYTYTYFYSYAHVFWFSQQASELYFADYQLLRHAHEQIQTYIRAYAYGCIHAYVHTSPHTCT